MKRSLRCAGTSKLKFLQGADRVDSTGLHFRKNPEFFCAPLAGALVNLAEDGESSLIAPPPFAGPLGRAGHSR